MISQNLICADDHEFEIWFRNIDDCKKQLARGLAQCPICNSTAIDKRLNHPNLGAKNNQLATKTSDGAPKNTPRVTPSRKVVSPNPEDFKKAIAAMNEYVRTNFDDVGNELPEIARKMYYGEEDQRNVYGHASPHEVEDLRDEGITIQDMPWFRDRSSNIN